MQNYGNKQENCRNFVFGNRKYTIFSHTHSGIVLLHGQIVLIRGNHDPDCRKLQNLKKRIDFQVRHHCNVTCWLSGQDLMYSQVKVDVKSSWLDILTWKVDIISSFGVKNGYNTNFLRIFATEMLGLLSTISSRPGTTVGWSSWWKGRGARPLYRRRTG